MLSTTFEYTSSLTYLNKSSSFNESKLGSYLYVVISFFSSVVFLSTFSELVFVLHPVTQNKLNDIRHKKIFLIILFISLIPQDQYLLMFRSFSVCAPNESVHSVHQPKYHISIMLYNTYYFQHK